MIKKNKTIPHKNSPFTVFYCVGFHEDGYSGKRKATQEKLNIFQKRYQSFYFFSPGKKSAKYFGSYFAGLLVEIRVFFLVIFTKTKPDILFSRTYFGHLYALIGILYKIPVVREVHSSFLDEAKILYKKNRILTLLSRIVHYVDLSGLKLSSGVIFNNPDLEKHFIKEYNLKKDRTTSIYNGSNTTEFYPEDKGYARAKLGINSSAKDIVMVFTGSVSQWHGVEFLLDTFCKLQETPDEYTYYLYIVGGNDSDYHVGLKKKFSSVKNLYFVNEVPVQVAKDYINSADLCMMPVAEIRVSQGSPLKLYDYIACGKPIVTQKDVNGYSDVVNEYSLGRCVNFYEPEKASVEIRNFIKDSNLDNISIENRSIAEEKLNWENVIDNWIRFAEKIN